MKILVVDDEASVLLTLIGNLELEGYEVAEADGARRALELIERESFDLVLSDIRMPGMDGVALLREIRARRADLPVVLMTAFAVESALADAIRAGVYTVVAKPLDLDHLVAVLAIAARQPFVVVVDDDRSVAASTAEVLTEAGVRARAASDVADVLAIVARGETDICLVDLPMTAADGAELMAQIHAADPAVACVAVSGPDTPGRLSRIAAAASTLLRSPVTQEQLLRTIVDVRGRRR